MTIQFQGEVNCY